MHQNGAKKPNQGGTESEAAEVDGLERKPGALLRQWHRFC
jgi:hypothetical protein